MRWQNKDAQPACPTRSGGGREGWREVGGTSQGSREHRVSETYLGRKEWEHRVGASAYHTPKTPQPRPPLTPPGAQPTAVHGDARHIHTEAAPPQPT